MYGEKTAMDVKPLDPRYHAYTLGYKGCPNDWYGENEHQYYSMGVEEWLCGRPLMSEKDFLVSIGEDPMFDW